MEIVKVSNYMHYKVTSTRVWIFMDGIPKDKARKFRSELSTKTNKQIVYDILNNKISMVKTKRNIKILQSLWMIHKLTDVIPSFV